MANRTKPDELLPLAEAAQRLGLSYDVARKRVKAGTLPAERQGGRWFVHVPKPDTEPDAEPESIRPKPEPNRNEPDAGRELVDALREEVNFLRRELETRTDELQRRDVLLREALTRFPALPSGQDATAPSSSRSGSLSDAASAPLTPSGQGPTPGSPPRPWWAFWRR